jgi:hypothetical protein
LQPRFAGFSRRADEPGSNRTIICHVISRSRDIMRYSKRFFYAIFRSILGIAFPLK